MKIYSSVVASVSLTAAFFAPVAMGSIDLISESDLGSRKKLQAVVEETCDEVLESVVYTKVGATWVVDECESVKTEDAMLEETPMKEVIEMWSMVTTDCNGNGVADLTDIANGAMDWDNDGTPDSCEYAIGDLNLNGVINEQDLSILLGWWGIANPMVGDLNGDNKVDGTDMGILLARYGIAAF